MRLRARGWSLLRLPMVAVEHYGHSVDAYRLLWRRLRTGYAFGAGEVLRAAIGRSDARGAIAAMPELKLYGASLLWWASLAALAAWGGAGAAALGGLLFALPFIAMIAKRRSFRLGAYAVVAWSVNMIGTIIGLLRPRRDPKAWVDSRIVQASPAPTSAQPAA
jgi:hypothetical protein